MNDPQSVFNILVLGASGAIGWVLKMLYNSIKSLQDTDVRLAESVDDIKDNYARRDDVKEWMKDIKDSLGRIESKIDRKVDK
jgi:hypothetical protein